MHTKSPRGFIGLGALIAIVIGLIVVGGGAYYLVHHNTAPVQQSYPDLSTTNSSQPTQNATNSGSIQQTNQASSNSATAKFSDDADTQRIVSENLHINAQLVSWGRQVVTGADASSFHYVVGSRATFFADTTHAWYLVGKGVLVQIPGADGKTFTLVAQYPSPIAKDGTGHYYSLNGQNGNIEITSSYPYQG